MENFSQGAEWTTRYKNDLPDSAFLYIEAGGKRDSEGKIKPRSLRHFPYKDADGKVDRAHILNAIARIPQAKFLSQAQKDRLQARARKIYLNWVKKNSKKANSFELALNKLAAAVHMQQSSAKTMDRWYEDPYFYAAENMSPDAIIENVSIIIRGSKCLQKCLASETFAGMGTWEETLRKFVWSHWVSLEQDHSSEPNDLMIGSVVHMQTLQWLRSICPNCFTNIENTKGSMQKVDIAAQDVYDIIVRLYSSNECVMKALGDLNVWSSRKRGNWQPDFMRYLNSQAAELRKLNPIWSEDVVRANLMSLAHQWIEGYALDCFRGTVLG